MYENKLSQLDQLWFQANPWIQAVVLFVLYSF